VEVDDDALSIQSAYLKEFLMTKISDNDPDRAKGAVDDTKHEHDGNAALEEQLGHRDQDPILKDADSDFPEPGNNPEHSGESAEPRKSKIA
jgi:hypothetical protein